MKKPKQWLDIGAGHHQSLKSHGDVTARVHVFDQASIDSINAAMAAQRPLLVRGEPGIGKSQLAFAAAEALQRPCFCKVIDSHTSALDLLWTFDAVSRLAEAQLAGALRQTDESIVRAKLDVKNFVKPEALWWALSWKTARDQAKQVRSPIEPVPEAWNQETGTDGTVVLIDEIDKADSDVPNGLLEVLGNGRFRPPGYDRDLVMTGLNPLVVITTNEERALPDAFLRRCMVLQIQLPVDTKALEDLLVERGRAHFPEAPKAVLERAAQQLVRDRKDLQSRRLPAPGQAEFLDLVRAVMTLAAGETERLALLDRVSSYALQKHPRDAVG